MPSSSSCSLLLMRLRPKVMGIGFRYRLHRKDLPGRPDLVLPKYKVAVFVHGCFWHWHRCMVGRLPSSNVNYWLPKLKGNIARDARNQRALRESGWTVRVIWECEALVAASALAAELQDLRSRNETRGLPEHVPDVRHDVHAPFPDAQRVDQQAP